MVDQEWECNIFQPLTKGTLINIGVSLVLNRATILIFKWLCFPVNPLMCVGISRIITVF